MPKLMVLTWMPEAPMTREITSLLEASPSILPKLMAQSPQQFAVAIHKVNEPVDAEGLSIRVTLVVAGAHK